MFVCVCVCVCVCACVCRYALLAMPLSRRRWEGEGHEHLLLIDDTVGLLKVSKRVRDLRDLADGLKLRLLQPRTNQMRRYGAMKENKSSYIRVLRVGGEGGW